MDPKLEEVFKLSGVPSHTFVPPARYPELLVCLRRPGRGLVVEGASGIGKTTAVVKALEELGITFSLLRARRDADRELIGELPNIADAGMVVIDDFHRLQEDTRRRIADYMKVLADEENETTKLVLVGVNRAGDALIQTAAWTALPPYRSKNEKAPGARQGASPSCQSR